MRKVLCLLHMIRILDSEVNKTDLPQFVLFAGWGKELVDNWCSVEKEYY